MVRLFTDYVETTKEGYSLNIGGRLLIAGVSNGQLSKYVPYKPSDKIDCRRAFGESALTKAYWEAFAQGATDILCIGIDDMSPQSIQNMIASVDNCQFDILAIPEMYSSNLEALILLDDFVIKSSVLGNGFICIFSAEPRNSIIYEEYINDITNKIILVNNKIKYPKYFASVAGEVTYNYRSKFEYTTTATASYAGLLASIKPYVNSTRKSLNGVVLPYEFTSNDVTSLLSAGYTPIIYTSNFHECISRGNTLEGNNYFHTSHVRVANVVNQSVGNNVKQYIGNAINIIDIRNSISYVLDYYKNNGYYREYDYDIVNSSRGEVTVNIRLLPNDIMNNIDTMLKVVLQKV